MKKHILALALTLALLITPALAFSDVPDPETSLAAETLFGLGIVSGSGEGSYYPANGLTRAQFCKLAVLAEGHGDAVSASAYKTLFSDVPAGNWAAPYVNLAYTEGLISGYGNGAFGPEDQVSVAQAVTISLHLLGYTNAEIGPFWPEDYMDKAAELGLLDSISSDADHAITRGEAAKLIGSLLSTDTAQGRPFYEGLGATCVTAAVLLDADGVEVYANGAVSEYTAATDLPAALEGKRGVLLLNKAGKVCGFLPDNGDEQSLTVETVDSETLNTLSVANAVPVLIGTEKATWADCWYNLKKGDEAVVYDSAAGVIDLIWVKERVAEAHVTITGYYEDATPNTTAPGTITVLGAALPVTDEGRTALKDYAVGDKITVTLDRDGSVAAVRAASATDAAMVGVLKSATASLTQVELVSGVTVSGKPYSTASAAPVGSLVKVSANPGGKLSASALGYTAATMALEDMTQADDVRVYEQVNGSVLTEINRDDILAASVPATSILHAGAGADGKINLLVLNDVTGACYRYGILTAGEQSGGSGDMKYTNTTVAVENSSGTGTAYITGLSFQDGSVGGVAATAEGKTAAIIALTAQTGLTRTDFDGTDSVGGIPIAEDVQVYNARTEKWTTLSAAKAFTNSFTAYYDKTPTTGGQVRVILCH